MKVDLQQVANRLGHQAVPLSKVSGGSRAINRGVRREEEGRGEVWEWTDERGGECREQRAERTA